MRLSDANQINSQPKIRRGFFIISTQCSCNLRQYVFFISHQELDRHFATCERANCYTCRIPTTKAADWRLIRTTNRPNVGDSRLHRFLAGSIVLESRCKEGDWALNKCTCRRDSLRCQDNRQPPGEKFCAAQACEPEQVSTQPAWLDLHAAFASKLRQALELSIDYRSSKTKIMQRGYACCLKILL